MNPVGDQSARWLYRYEVVVAVRHGFAYHKEGGEAEYVNDFETPAG